MKKKISIYVVLLVVICFLMLYRLDAYIMKPGSAYDVSKFVTVENNHTENKGSMSLMTVAMQQATPFSYLWAKTQKYQKLMDINQVRNPLEDEEEYNVRQLKLMSDSQFNAKYIAFQKAGLQTTIHFDGVFVLNVLDGGASDGLLKAGDEIIEVDGHKISNQQMLVDLLKPKELGDKATVRFIRNKNEQEVTITLKEIPRAEEKRAGLGISYAESKSIETNPKVTMKTEDIGGPSAGLMFTLEILDQLLKEDLTKGYAVAGTGEMLVDGSVGRIGGIDYKVIAADRDGMEIFFAPDDEISPELKAKHPELESNYATAVKTAKEIGTKMKIVPVKTVDDAINYLKQLQPK
ncbi:SepM family pheromone-processing serine protease [Lysinibacillus pakistanensis]|uniref:endopeptidase La n=1 Tax=Lysinibacillus pakistanensis TaxID=759811 RepID=A0AAX3X1R0_9BACI|nr:SepM family pheromone-processing serine protease [Lysinibacillus pakistanensis]MDM5232108.1 SepM family pheromone-processing serine protease [Lysinibacillus pakistanensis]QGG50288.1 PDZ domain-containing protein [Lysinibacillus pakistanensis]WHY47632.1 SepM family pheromone-processing serine protease [Lysinibacillus pakistanensis]WHY52642.1 SepM family pheromone-processing serine protease [Lysinibacillus pakistanensis]